MTTLSNKPISRPEGQEPALWLYNGLLLLASPVLLLWLLWRMFVRGKSREGLGERLGKLPEAARKLGKVEDPVAWFHAVSVGEVAALQPVLQVFRIKEPLAHVALSTTTATGRRMVAKQELDPDAIFYFPFDLLPVVRRVFSQLNPDLMVMVEGEVWPNVLAVAAQQGVKTCIINGRFSDSAFRRARLAAPIFRWMLAKLDLLCVQSQTDADRFIALGARPDRVRIVGNSKFDERFPEVSDAEAAKMRQEFGFGEEDPVLVAGSTHAGEDEIVLHAYSDLCTRHGNLQLVLAPRHPERGDQIQQLIEKHGFQVYRRSLARAGQPQPEPVGPQARVVLLDTIGELARVYALAEVVFVGGSLVKIGGHNILQPIAQGKPVLTGPYTHNFRGIMNIALEAGAVEVVRNADELTQAIDRLLRDRREAQRRRERGLAMLQEQRGASERMAEALAELLKDAAPRS
ncbi:MAG: 3-deoxy-D-manno-octulosonic acid transferase [Armatimonadetes bacterium]|nr:3-deoxy-D-manno-octulosonic acid transferase [Armatimonadota bacterium]